MAKDGDDKGFDEHTRIGVAPPKLPGAPTPAAPTPATPTPPTPPAPPALDEHTRISSAPPKLPGAPAPTPPPAPAAPPLEESTRLAVTPPPVPKAPAAPPAAPVAPSASSAAPVAPPTVPAMPPPPAGGGGDFAEHTILLADLQKEFVPPARLQRMQPPGRSDIINLDRTHYLMGRLPSCDLRLYSQTASREHAQLTVRDGRWYLTPVAGKAVLVNGTQVKEEVPLTHKMRIQLGGDELVFLDESGRTAIEEAPRAGSVAVAEASNRWLALLVALLALAMVLWLWATR